MADGSLIFDTKLDTSGLSTGLGGIGKVAGAALAGVAAAAGAAAAAVGMLAKSSLEGYANYEQLVGGVQTLFGTGGKSLSEYAEATGSTIADIAEEWYTLERSQQAVFDNASKAYMTAGMSQNEYMETVTSFSASLIQSLGGDTEKAASVADQAITDMSDNANKMGTSMEMIQNAYQGFAKQNYTMLDNLKLGYGGTKEEMQRLLDDAEKISGIEYDISSFADVTEAIHVMQEEMGIAGATYDEAATTIEGSLKMVKASWQNLVVGLADENANLDVLISQFVDSVATAGENILPVVQTILTGIGELIQTMLPVIMDMLPSIINDTLPQLLEAGISIVESLITGITQNLDSLMSLALDIVMQLVDVIVTNLPALIEAGLQVIVTLALGIAQAIPELIPTIVDTVLTIVDTLIANIGLLVDAAIAIMVALADGLIAALPQLVARVPEIVIKLVSALAENSPRLLEAGLNLIVTLAEAIITYVPELLAKVPEVISSLVSSFLEYASELLEVGERVVTNIMDAITNTWSSLTGSVPGWLSDLKDDFITGVQSFTDIGQNIIDGIWNGLSAGWSWLTDKVGSLASGLLSAAKTALGIASPSKKFKYLGEMCVAGFDEGAEDLMDGDAITKGINASLGTVVANTSVARGSVAGGFNQTININKEISTPDELARAIRLESKYGLMKGVAFA